MTERTPAPQQRASLETPEAIERWRTALHQRYMNVDLVNSLCDLALKGLAPPSERGESRPCCLTGVPVDKPCSTHCSPALREAVLEEAAKAAEQVTPRHTECGNKIARAIRALKNADSPGTRERELDKANGAMPGESASPNTGEPQVCPLWCGKPHCAPPRYCFHIKYAAPQEKQPSSGQPPALASNGGEPDRADVPAGAAPCVELLSKVRDEWYRFTGYSQLKADIDALLATTPNTTNGSQK